MTWGITLHIGNMKTWKSDDFTDMPGHGHFANSFMGSLPLRLKYSSNCNKCMKFKCGNMIDFWYSKLRSEMTSVSRRVVVISLQ